MVLPKDYKRPPPLGGKVPEPDLTPLDETLDLNGMQGKNHSLTAAATPRGGAQNSKA